MILEVGKSAVVAGTLFKHLFLLNPRVVGMAYADIETHHQLLSPHVVL